MNEYIAFIIFSIILLALYFWREGYYSGLYNPTLGQHINYDFDLPLKTSGYNIIYSKPEPPKHDMVLYTEQNFRAIAVPVRKNQLYLFAEQLSPHFKSWHYKSFIMKPNSKIRLSSISKNRSTAINFMNNNPTVSNINTFIKSNSKIMTSDFGNNFDKNILDTKYYLQELG